MFKTIKRAVKKLSKAVKNDVSMYVVTCNMGTNQRCYTLAEAQGWLKYCGANAAVYNSYTNRLVCGRIKHPRIAL